MFAIPARPASVLFRHFVDFVVPPRCLVCHADLAEPSSLCPACWSSLAQIDEPVCEVLGLPFAFDRGDGAVSEKAYAEPPAWDRARSAVIYDDASRPIVHMLKFHDTAEAGLLMARLMGRAGRKLLAETDLIVPVPLHRRKLWQRRFNQSAQLADRLARQAVKPWRGDILIRIKPTRPQVGLSADTRQRNVRGAFRVDRTGAAGVAGRNILLIDDVLTTGATASACATALKRAGAARVDVLTFALVVSPYRPHVES